MLRRSRLYITASDPSRVALEVVVAHISGWNQCAAVEAARGQVGSRPNFTRLEHAGRRDLSLTASLYGRPEAFERAGVGHLLVPGRPGYCRVRIHEFVELPALLRAMDIGWRERRRRPVAVRGGRQ